MSPEQIADHAVRHRVDDCPFDGSSPIDFTKPFVCPTLTALYYTPIWKELAPEIQLRYTQLSALSFNELIASFEDGFSTTMAVLWQCKQVPKTIRELLPVFLEDERRHQNIWWTLNRKCEPQRYPENAASISRMAPAGRLLMNWFASHPLQFPVVIWVILLLEEHGNEIARRCAVRRPNEIEPHFAAAYLAHVRDEARHVQIDWHLIDCLWPNLSGWRRTLNVWLLRMIIRRMLLRTEHAAISVVMALAREYPVLRPLLPRMRRELRDVGAHPEFRAMMFSVESSPITFHLIQKFPELKSVVA